MKRTFDFIKNIKIVRPLDSSHDYETTIGDYYEGACEDIDKGISRLEKLEKIVEIIRKKKPHFIVVYETEDVDTYNNYVKAYGGKTLTKDEYISLKEAK